ncbi:MAG: nitronate monooxygenase [Patescibacteria group bacterium]|nr:nitronate monooxygenase [Patescibacteria group bacterium]
MYKIIQGGMGVFISTPFLAKICSNQPQVLGTVSGVALEKVLARILQSGDIGGHFRRALANFPFPGIAERIIEKYFVDGGIPKNQKFKSVPVFTMNPAYDLIELTVAGSFAFVWLAKEGHSNHVSVNYLEKIQIPHIFALFGAMLAGVDFVTMGAGITLQIPSVLDTISQGGNPSYRVLVEGNKNGSEVITFEPKKFFQEKIPELKRPGFLPIVSTDVLAELMTKRLPKGSIQGFVIEQPIAGGHNAPPRGKLTLDEKGQPIYGPRDEVNFKKLQDLGIPFWVGGGFASPENLAKAKELGAEGIQAGSIFALCEDSGMDTTFRKEIRRLGYRNELVVRTDPKASPTGFPFKVVELPGTQSESSVCEARKRLCDICVLRTPYQREDGTVDFRCSGEPVEEYVRKGGKLEDTIGTCCICNGLLSAVGLGNPDEPPIFTLGDDFSFLRHLMFDEKTSYTAKDAIAYLL